MDNNSIYGFLGHHVRSTVRWINPDEFLYFSFRFVIYILEVLILKKYFFRPMFNDYTMYVRAMYYIRS